MASPKGFVQHDEVIEVPKGTGVEGFLRTVKEVLKLPRVQDIHIDSRGKIEYTFFLREGEQKRALTMKFDDLMPYALVRNSKVVEVQDPPNYAAGALLAMFRAASLDHVIPIAFVMGANSAFWGWYEASTGMKAEIQEELLGLPIYTDRACPDEVLLLCAAFSRGSELVEVQKAYKINIPERP